MILNEITLTNFGIYGGQLTFQLSPIPSDQFNKPLVVFRGKNGVGKSTLVEAIRLCLHGPLVLGSRVRQRDYEEYLRQRFHRGDDSEESSDNAAIKLSFDYVRIGQRQTYEVERKWEKRKTGVVSSVAIWENDQPLDYSDDEKEHFLRELVSPGLADLFFFDGEKIATLAESGDESDVLLAETVKNLLGLHLVEQLDSDLDVFLTRQTGIRELHVHQMELETLQSELTEFKQRRDEVRDILTSCRERIVHQHQAISLTEQKIAEEGGIFATRRTKREKDRQQLESAIGLKEQEIHELCRELVPYSVAPRLLASLKERLQLEAKYERWKATQDVLGELRNQLAQSVSSDELWEGVEQSRKEKGQQLQLKRIDRLFATYATAPMKESEVLHRLSEESRSNLLAWAENALTETPMKLAASMHELNLLRARLQKVDQQLEKAPLGQILVPLQMELRKLERDFGRLEAEQDRLVAEEHRLDYHIERNAGSRRRVSEEITQIEVHDDRIKLAARTKLLLAEYHERIAQRKLHQLEAQLVKRFNQLCRKRNFIGQVTINPKSFDIVLYQNGQPFPRRQLSAGEKQLFAIATLWALREVSGRPLPVIIDTPLSRLDSEHRQTMVESFFPQIAHQVILLATDTEIDEATMIFLRPAIAREYVLREQEDTGQLQVLPRPVTKQVGRIHVEEIEINA